MQAGGRGRPLVLLEVDLALLLEEGSGSSSSYSLRNFRLAVSEPCPELPQFIAVSYVDDQPIVHYDSHARRVVLVAPWMSKVEQDDSQYWDEESQVFRGNEELFRQSLVTLLDHFHHNSSTGLHTLQLMISCKVSPDGQPGGGQHQYAYDGEDFITFDKETLTWAVFMPQAEILKQKLGPLLAHPQHEKDYLEETCVESLRKYLDYGNETLQRTETPTVRVARKKGYDHGQDILFCQLYGFYPKEIRVTWIKKGKHRRLRTLTGGVVPNSDGTYHTWLSIKVDSKDRNDYRCHVEHDSLTEPLDLVLKEPSRRLSSASISGTHLDILGVLVMAGALVVSAFVVWIIIILRFSGQPCCRTRDGDTCSFCFTTLPHTSAGLPSSQPSVVHI